MAWNCIITVQNTRQTACYCARCVGIIAQIHGLTVFFFKINATEPYMPSEMAKRECSTSSKMPSLLVHNPLGNCRAACVGTLSFAKRAIFVNPRSFKALLQIL